MDKRQITGTLIIAISVMLFFVLFFTIGGTKNDKIVETTVGRSFTITNWGQVPSEHGLGPVPKKISSKTI
jgi:hypothetical protein